MKNKKRQITKRFSASGGVAPQKRQYEFERGYPARKSVRAATAGEAAGTLSETDGKTSCTDT